MQSQDKKIKISFVHGLKSVVLQEIKTYDIDISILKEGADFVDIKYFEEFEKLKNLKSASRIYLVVCDVRYNPAYISKHKSILGDCIQDILQYESQDIFKTYHISCAGSHTIEVKKICAYIQDTFDLQKSEQADLKISLSKDKEVWEIAIQMTSRPLSVRNYKIAHMSGAMDPTIAYALNQLSRLEHVSSYLNIFSGSGTLLIEAVQNFPHLTQVIGFDNDKKNLSFSIQNIKKAGLIKKIQIKEYDIFDNPDIGIFDVIVSDLPFGMKISKNQDLEKLYTIFVQYSQNHIKENGILSVYTSEHEILEKILSNSKFKIDKKLPLKIITSEGLYLTTCIFVCHKVC